MVTLNPVYLEMNRNRKFAKLRKEGNQILITKKLELNLAQQPDFN